MPNLNNSTELALFYCTYCTLIHPPSTSWSGALHLIPVPLPLQHLTEWAKVLRPSWHNITTDKLNLTNKQLLDLFICVCIALCTTVSHKTAQNRTDNFPSYPPGNHHCSNDIYLRDGKGVQVRALDRQCCSTTSLNQLVDQRRIRAVGDLLQVWSMFWVSFSAFNTVG